MVSKWYTVYTLFLKIPTVDKTVTLSNGWDSTLFITQFVLWQYPHKARERQTGL